MNLSNFIRALIWPLRDPAEPRVGAGTLRARAREANYRAAQAERLKGAAPPVISRQQDRARLRHAYPGVGYARLRAAGLSHRGR